MTISPCFLVGDVGATNTRLAITTMRNGAVEWVHEVRVADADIPSFDAALDTLFAASPVERTRIAVACLGVAAPILDHPARFTHRDWTIDANAITATLGGAPAKLVNDLTADKKGHPRRFGSPHDKLDLEERGYSDHFPVTVRLHVQP